MKSLVGVQSMKNLLSVRVVKVTLAMFVFVSMMINVFVPKNMENKEQIKNVVCLVFNNIVVKTIRGCTDTLVVMSSEMTKDLCKLLMLGEVGTDAPVKNEREEDVPANTSSDSGIEIENRDYKELVRFILEEGLMMVLTVEKVEEKLYRLYGNIKVYCSQLQNIMILFFIMFIVAIKKRKGNIEKVVKIYGKIKLICAKKAQISFIFLLYKK